MLPCPIVCQPIWPACWLDTPDRSSSSAARNVQDVWDLHRDALGTVPEEVVLALRGAASGPYAWLRRNVVPPSPFLVIKDPQTQSSQILVEPHLVDAEFRKAWMPFFCRSGHPVVAPDQFWGFVGHLLPQEPQFDLPWISGRDLQEIARDKKSTAGGLDGVGVE